MTDTPELFGGELRILAAIDFADGKIVRWVDYWDSSAFDDALYAQFRTPAGRFPTDLKDAEVPRRRHPRWWSRPPRCSRHSVQATRRPRAS